MSCENIKNDLHVFSFKIVCENDLKRASDTPRNPNFFGGDPRTPLTRGAHHLPLVLSPCLCIGTQFCGNDTKIAEPPISYLEPFTSNHKMENKDAL